MKRITAFCLLAPLFLLLRAETGRPLTQPERPDVVFIIVDDLNDYVGCLGGHPDGYSPNIDALASSGMLFTQAYCNAPQCRPSRTSLNHGVLPTRSGVYFNADGGHETKIKTPTLQQFFLNQGYRVASGGKVHHGGPGGAGDALLKRPRDPKPPKDKDPFHALNPPSDGYPLDVADEEMGDYQVASWAIDQWEIRSEKPLFMSVGFFRPHRPLQVPKPYFDQFPVEEVRRPAEPARGDDWDDLPEFARKMARSHAHKAMHDGLSDHEYIVEHDQWEATLQAYLASIAFVDRQIGRFLDALKTNPRDRDTVILLVSDHGWHLGEKKHWCKAAIWEQTTRIPFIVQAPGIEPGSACLEPVSLVDVFPTLVELAGLEVPGFLDGRSVVPQLKDPNLKRPAVISSYGVGNTTVRTRDWRYILYEDGSEELYDHRSDPDEWTNLAGDPQFENVKEKLRARIPSHPTPSVAVQSWFDATQ